MQEQTVLITGASRGIGLEIAQFLRNLDYRVIGTSTNSGGVQLIDQALGSGGKGIEMQIDNDESVVQAFSKMEELEESPRILINNAGRTWGSDLNSFPYDAWAKVLNLNVSAIFYLTQKLVPLLASSSKSDFPSRVVNMGSVMGEVPMGDGAYSYAASKSAVHHITRILAKELAERNITVNALSPGPFQSNMTDFAIGDSKVTMRVSKRVPLKRIGQTDDIAASIQFLCGKGGSYVTGAILPISGGINVSTGPSIFGED